MKFRYEAKDGMRGTSEADTAEVLLVKLRKMGFSLSKIWEINENKEVLLWEDKIIDDSKNIAQRIVGASPVPIEISPPPARTLRGEPLQPPHVTSEQVSRGTSARRKQSFLSGPYSEIRGFIDEALSLNGKVVKLKTNNDLRGNVVISIVIEHDIQERKS